MLTVEVRQIRLQIYDYHTLNKLELTYATSLESSHILGTNMLNVKSPTQTRIVKLEQPRLSRTEI